MATESASSLGETAGGLGAIERVVRVAAAGGIAASLVGFVEGVVLMAKRKVAGCPNGHYFPPGTKNFSCYAHPRLAEGLGISATSLSLGALVLIVASVSLVMLRLNAT